MPATGGKPRQLSDQKRPDFAFKVVAAGDAVVASSRKDLLHVDVAGGAVAKANIRGLTEYPEEIVADAAFVYVTMFKQPQIMRVPAGGGSAQQIGELARGVLALRGDTLYVASYATGVLVALPKAGGKPRTIAKGLVRPTALAVDATHAFVYSEKDRTIQKIDLVTGKASVIATNLTNSDELVLDGAWLYTRSWDKGSAGSLVRIATTGAGGAEVIGGDLAAPYGIAFDAEAIYVTARDGAQIIRFDKAALPAR
jgi:DNA-binding beta-propeller fold protein YncE